MPDLTNDQIIAHVLEVANPVLSAAGAELVELKVGRHKSDILIQVTADKITGGINIEECCTLNRSIALKLDEAGVIPIDHYALELMSPGLDRPLKSAKDFKRNLNAGIHFYLNQPVNGKCEVIGILQEVGPEGLKVSLGKKGEVVIALSNIIKGLLVL